MNFAEEGKYRCSDHPTKKRKRSGDLTYEQKEEVRASFNHTCAIPDCGGEAFEVNHIIELDQFPEEQKWRANLRENLNVLCFYHHQIETARYRKSKIVIDDVNDRSTSARNRKKKRRRSQGFHY
ncbi:MAG: hypothetical protein PHW63_11370 [Alphaproteobacteria bacterium]|nr:hypothetical protein [Alphaproteobacteria bacterium]